MSESKQTARYRFWDAWRSRLDQARRLRDRWSAFCRAVAAEWSVIKEYGMVSLATRGLRLDIDADPATLRGAIVHALWKLFTPAGNRYYRRRRPLLTQAVKELPSLERQVLLLSIDYNIPASRIAERLKLPYGEVIRMIGHGYSHLRFRLPELEAKEAPLS